MGKIWLTLAAASMTVALSIPAALAQRADETPTGVPQQSADDRVEGNADAPNTIIEYASLGCPHCAHFDIEILPELRTKWIATGKAKYIFRDFPLDEVALKAAVLTRCAPADRFGGYVDTLFRSQETWHIQDANDATAALARIAKIGGMSQADFDKCMADEKLADRVTAERLQAANIYGVESTPTFFVNGHKVEGALPLKDLEAHMTDAAAPGSSPDGTKLATDAPAASPTPTAPKSGYWDAMMARIKAMWASK